MTRWYARPRDPEKQYVWLYGIVHDQLNDMGRNANAVMQGGRRQHVPIPDNSAAEIALQFWQSQPGASTVATRKEFVSRLQEFLGRNLKLGRSRGLFRFYRAMEDVTGRTVAVKTVLTDNLSPPEQVERFDTERRKRCCACTTLTSYCSWRQVKRGMCSTSSCPSFRVSRSGP